MDPILQDVPEEFETARLTVRAPRAGDGAEAHAAIVESAERLRVWIPWAKASMTVEEEEVRARERRIQFLKREELHFYMFLKGQDRLVGMCALHSMDWAVPRFEIGYWVRTCFEGQGYVQETVEGLTQLAFALGARRVEITTDPRNERSWRVAERAGFSLEGVLHNYERDVDGVLGDLRVYVKLRSDEEAGDQKLSAVSSQLSARA
jgi:RimJ/RimL family protein N-acetyltransferase